MPPGVFPKGRDIRGLHVPVQQTTLQCRLHLPVFYRAVRGEGEAVAYASDEPLRVECHSFLEAIAQRSPARTDGPSGLRVLRVLQAAQRSLVMNGEPVHLPMDGSDSLL